MILHKACPICSSALLKGYAIDCSRNGPHISRVKCAHCQIVFANPMADDQELMAFYQNYYNKGNFMLLNYKKRTEEEIKAADAYSADELRNHASFITKYKTGGRFLDIGCGLGAGLIYANKLGFDLYGTELDQDAIQFTNAHFKADIFHGDLLDAHFPENYFDYIYFNHVIEHVLNPRAYLKEIFRILKPGGVINIGTPDISSLIYRLYRTSCFLSFKTPKIIDGIEHTFLFSKQTLIKACQSAGFILKAHKNLSLEDSLNTILKSDMSARKKVSRFIQTRFNVNQEIICSKPE